MDPQDLPSVIFSNLLFMKGLNGFDCLSQRILELPCLDKEIASCDYGRAKDKDGIKNGQGEQ